MLGSREAQRAAEAAAAVVAAVPGAAVEGVDNVAAAAVSPLVVLSVPFSAQAKTVKQIGESLQPGQLVIDASVPLAAQVGGKPTQMLGVWQGSAAQQAASLLPEGVGGATVAVRVDRVAAGAVAVPVGAAPPGTKLAGIPVASQTMEPFFSQRACVPVPVLMEVGFRLSGNSTV